MVKKFIKDNFAALAIVVLVLVYVYLNGGRLFT